MQEDGSLGWVDARKKKMQELTSDILKGHYKIYLQPKIALSNEVMNSAEVLIRYQLQDEVILPNAFIQELEYFDIIHVLDMYVFELACYYLHKWKEEGYEFISLACNFSRITLQQDKLVDKLDRIRERYKVEASYLEIEITESIQVTDLLFYERIGKQLRKSGYKLTLDDFGSGYSDLVFLSSLPFTCIKFDKNVTQEITKGAKMMTLFKNMIQTSHDMGMSVVAEGVENITQKNLLRNMHCDYIQGYLIDKPMSVDDFESLYILQS